MCLHVASDVTLLEIPPCQIPMCGVAYSCSYVLLMACIARKITSSYTLNHKFSLATKYEPMQEKGKVKKKKEDVKADREVARHTHPQFFPLRAYSFCAVFLISACKRNSFHQRGTISMVTKWRIVWFQTGKVKSTKKLYENEVRKIRAAISTNFLSSPTALSSLFFLVSPRTCLHGYHQEMESCCCFDKRPFRRESGEKDAEHLKKGKSLLCFP